MLSVFSLYVLVVLSMVVCCLRFASPVIVFFLGLMLEVVRIFIVVCVCCWLFVVDCVCVCRMMRGCVCCVCVDWCLLIIVCLLWRRCCFRYVLIDCWFVGFGLLVVVHID